jgi:energy-coupling factor transport system permease protein
VRPAAALAILAALAAAALLAHHWMATATIAALLLAVCLRAPSSRRRPYLLGIAMTVVGVLVVTPFVLVEGSHVLWSGPIVPVLGQLDVTTEELASAGTQALRLSSITLAFAAYALLLDHDALLRSARFARRSALVVALATRLLPTLERDAHGLVEALRGRGVQVEGIRGRARLLSPVVAGSLERALNLAEAMEARGYGRAGATRAPAPAWRTVDRAAVAAAVLLVAVGVLWL